MKDNIYCVIMAGGTGSRLWPLSNRRLPKQFLDFYGTGETLLQQTYERYSKIVDKRNIYIVTNKEYTNLVINQLPQINTNNILAEPTRRNTAACLAWASYHIHAQKPNASIIFTPSDHIITKEDKFIEEINKGLHFIDTQEVLLCIGIRPHRAETRYGYIQIGTQDKENFYHIKTFTEKPEQDLAEIFVESGEFYWNSGIFLGKTHTIIEAIHTHTPELACCFDTFDGEPPFGNKKESEFIEKIFPACPNESIEYGILEKTDKAFIMTCDFGWSDLGTWSTYYDSLPKDENGNSRQRKKVMLYDCKNCFVGTRNKEKIIVVQGLDNYLVADTEKVLLICPKDDLNMLRKFINDTQVKMGDEFI